jgi:subtilisin-like proprotein convertase family protein/truncated hemoglobin YjbI
MQQRTPRLRALSLSLCLAVTAACNGDDGTTVGDSEGDSSSTSDTASTTGTTDASTTEAGTTTAADTTDGSDTEEATSTTGTSTTEGSTTAETTGGVESACDRLGGDDGLEALHLDFLARVLVDERINGYFLNSDVDGPALVACLSDQVGEALACPGADYACKNMQLAHFELGISTLDFADFVEIYAAALDDHQLAHAAVTDDDKAAILGALAATEADVVEDVDSNQTIYQRVGRKPALKAIVGDVDTGKTFINAVSADPMINGFFNDADFVRLATCFTRQLAAIDGPVEYGLEVDSPAAGVDEGVALDDPCADMMSSHAGLQDSKDNSLITYFDFTQVLSDLVVAMDAAAIAENDQLAIIGVLGPLCENIVGDHPNDCPGNNTSMTIDANGVNLAIPDDGYTGTKASMICAGLTIDDDGINYVAEVEVEVGINHPWLGDLVIKVYSPAQTAITVLSRAGMSELADDGSGVSVEGSDLSAGAPITFLEDAPFDAETLGDGVNLGNSGVACQDDGRCEYTPNHGAATPGSLADFAGELAPGTWQICVGDAGSADKGTLVNASIKLRKVKYTP